MDLRLQVAILLLAFSRASAAQVAPQATGPGNPLPAGNLNYSIRYAQTAEFGADLGDLQTSALSGSVNYSNNKGRAPFSLQYSGEYNWGIEGPAYETGFYHHLTVSQGLSWRRWNVSLGDNVSYSPEAPTIGFTGIPGIGEPVVGSTPAPPPDQSILALNTHVVDNTANGDISRSMSHALTLDLGGSYDLFRFPDGNGLNTDTISGNSGVTWRLNGRNSLSSSYSYSQFSYPDANLSIQSDTGYFGFQRNWNRKLTTSVSLGPQWTTSSHSALVPSTLGVSVNATLTYQFTYSSAGVTYSRGVNNGAGYLIGGEVDTASANYSREFGKRVTLGFTASYMRTSGLLDNGITTAKYGGIEMTRRLGRYLVVFANYSATVQSSSSALPGNALGQLFQVAGFGFGYSPRGERHTR
jgi:hypothetical protein